MNEDERAKTSEFITRRHMEKFERDEETIRVLTGGSNMKNRFGRLKERTSGIPLSYRKLIRNVAVCAALVLCVWGIKSADSEFTNTIANGVAEATGSELLQDEDLGKLKFVNEDVSDGSAEQQAVNLAPVDGEVITTFAESGKQVDIEGKEFAEVKAILAGIVCATGEESIIVQNDNGTKTTYLGVVPGVKVGSKVEANTVIGQLSKEILSLETVSGTGYLNSLSEKDLLEQMTQ